MGVKDAYKLRFLLRKDVVTRVYKGEEVVDSVREN